MYRRLDMNIVPEVLRVRVTVLELPDLEDEGYYSPSTSRGLLAWRHGFISRKTSIFSNTATGTSISKFRANLQKVKSCTEPAGQTVADRPDISRDH